MLQDKALDLNNIKFGDFVVTVRNILRSPDAMFTALDSFLTQRQIVETQAEITVVLNKELQSIINDTEISWALDDAMDIFMSTGSGLIIGNLYLDNFDVHYLLPVFKALISLGYFHLQFLQEQSLFVH